MHRFLHTIIITSGVATSWVVLTDGLVGIAGAGAGAFVVRKHTGQHGTLERDIYVILRPCLEALVRFHASGGDACLG